MSNNINYVYNVEYFETLKLKEEKEEKGLTFVLENVKNPKNYSFITDKTSVEIKDFKEFKFKKFELVTTYPGLLVGTGYMHEISSNDAVKCGFSLDFVTGLPYLPGSSLKGALRSYFPENVMQKDKTNAEMIAKKNESKAKMIATLLGKEMNVDDIKALRDNIFENRDVFLDAFPVIKSGDRIIENDFITPHSSPLENPNPIHIIKVKPNVDFNFQFLLSDYKNAETIVVSADEKLELFKQIILLMGLGAKTNVGFGKFCEKDKMPTKKDMKETVQFEAGKNDTHGKRALEKGTHGKCRTCGMDTEINNKTGKYFMYCVECNKEWKKHQ